MIYLDTSLVVSLYSVDANSTRAVKLLQEIKEELLVTALAELEAINAFGLREFRREITRQEAETSFQNFQEDMRNRVFQLRAIPLTAFERASKLSRLTTPQLGTRTADLLHVAAAIELSASAFFSFDAQQRKAAQAAGLPINPLS